MVEEKKNEAKGRVWGDKEEIMGLILNDMGEVNFSPPLSGVDQSLIKINWFNYLIMSLIFNIKDFCSN